MKKLLFLMPLLLGSVVCFANYTGTVTTSQSELTFSTKSGYNLASFKGGRYTNTVGAPQIPVKTLSFLIPIDQKVSSIVINNTTVQQISGSYTIYPVQKSILTAFATASAGFDNPDPSIYNSTNPYPGATYSTSNDGYPMGYHVVTVNFYPLQFVPANHILNLYTSINFTIVYATNTDVVLVPNRQSVYSNNLSKDYIRGLVTNPNDLGTVTGGAKQVVDNTSAATQNIRGMSPTNLNTIPSYIIITRSDLVNSFQTLANWKTQKGINTLIVKTDGADGIFRNYSGYDNAEKIRNYLKDVYINFGSSYVLLGGDVKDASGGELIPTRFAYVEIDPYSGFPNFKETDYYYATVQKYWNDDGDNLFGEDSDNPDMARKFFVGRAPAQTAAEASNFSNKVITYENLKNNSNQLLSNPNYVKNFSYMDGLTAGTLDLLDAPAGIIPPSKNYHVLKLYDPIGTSGTAQLNHSNAFYSMNTGWANFGQSYGMNHLFYQMDHSGPEGMSTGSQHNGGSIGVGDMDVLTNVNYNSIFYSDGCDANSFASVTSVSKHFMNNQNGGGVAFLGNASYGISSDISFFRDYFMDALYNTGVVNGMPAYMNSRYHIGYLNWWTASNSYNWLGDFRRSLKDRALLGDPEMMVWTDTPQALGLTATYSAANKQVTGTVSGLTFVATPTVVVTVTAWKGAEIWQTKDINATASTPNPTYTFTDAVAHTTGNITVTATAHNYIPKVNTINVSSISGAHPYMTSYVINDDGSTGSVGNSDHFPDAGETIALPVTLTNSGNATASTVTAKLTWKAAPYQTQTGINATITINPTYSVSTFGNIVASGTANNNASPFRFTVNKNAFDNITPRPLTQFIKFALNVLVNGTPFSTDTFIVQITEPNLVKGENTVTGTLAANSTNNQLTVNLYNTGLSTAILSGVANAGVLSKTSSNITLTNATSTYPNITRINTTGNFAPNSTTFKFNMGSAAYTNETFTLTVTDKYAKTKSFPFNLSKPVINTTASTISHFGYASSIEPFWNIQLTSGTAKGYNIYRCNTQSGTYLKQNANILPYASYLDMNVLALTQYYYKVRVVDANGNESLDYPSTGYLASTTLPIHATTLPSPGWPVIPEPTSHSTTGGRCEGSPTTYDLLGDGNKEIFFTSGFQAVGGIWAFKNDGSRWYSIAPLITSYVDLQSGSSASPAIADIDNDGQAELSVTAIDNQLFAYKTTMAPVAPDNQPNFPLGVGWSGVAKGAVYSDIDNDGKVEIIRSSENDIKIFNSDGSVHAGWENITGYNCGFSMPVAFDFDGDGKKEIVVGCTGNGAHPSGIYIFKEDGTNYAASNPVYNALASGDRCDLPPVVADIDNDGFYDVLFISANGTTANIYAYSPHSGGLITGWNNLSHQFTITSLDATSCPNGIGTNSPTTCTCCGVFAGNLSVGDLNKDGNLEVIAGNEGVLHVWDKAGSFMTNITIPGGYITNTFKAPLIADVDNNSADLEIIVSGKAPAPGTGSNIYAYKISFPAYTVSPVKGFPISIPEEIGNSPSVDDIDNNRTNELIFTTGSKFYVWNTQGSSANNVYGWNNHRHDNFNSGIFYNEDGGFLYSNNNYLQHVTITNAVNKSRYYFAENILAGNDVVPHNVTQITPGDVTFTNGSKIILEGTKTVLLDHGVTVPLGCTLEIR